MYDNIQLLCMSLALTLSYTDAISAPASSAFGAGIGVIWLTNLLCNGTEQRLDNCSHDGWGNTASCGHIYDASVVCESNDSIGMGPQNFEVRLILGNDSYGILQVYFNGLWGTVCQDLFSDAAASVVCRQLGFVAGEAIWLDASISAEGVVWLDDVQCAGGEQNLDQCGHAPWGQHDCFPVHMLDVGVQCLNSEWVGMDGASEAEVGGVNMRNSYLVSLILSHRHTPNYHPPHWHTINHCPPHWHTSTFHPHPH